MDPLPNLAFLGGGEDEEASPPPRLARGRLCRRLNQCAERNKNGKAAQQTARPRNARKREEQNPQGKDRQKDGGNNAHPPAKSSSLGRGFSFCMNPWGRRWFVEGESNLAVPSIRRSGLSDLQFARPPARGVSNPPRLVLLSSNYKVLGGPLQQSAPISHPPLVFLTPFAIQMLLRYLT